MSNGKNYVIVEDYWSWYNEKTLRFWRYDSTTVYYYSTKLEKELIWYEIGKSAGEFWPTDRAIFCSPPAVGKTEYIAEMDVFGELRLAVGISFWCVGQDTVLSLGDVLVKGLGRYFLGGEGDHQILQGAIISGKQYGTITTVTEHKEQLQDFHPTIAVYPNPFNQETTIEIYMQIPQEITVKIFNLSGQIVKTLFSGYRSSGDFKLHWKGKDGSDQDVASGIYVINLEGTETFQAALLSLIK